MPRAMTPRRRWVGLSALSSATCRTALMIVSTSGVARTCAVVGAVRPHPVRDCSVVWSSIIRFFSRLKSAGHTRVPDTSTSLPVAGRRTPQRKGGAGGETYQPAESPCPISLVAHEAGHTHHFFIALRAGGVNRKTALGAKNLESGGKCNARRLLSDLQCFIISASDKGLFSDRRGAPPTCMLCTVFLCAHRGHHPCQPAETISQAIFSPLN